MFTLFSFNKNEKWEKTLKSDQGERQDHLWSLVFHCTECGENKRSKRSHSGQFDHHSPCGKTSPNKEIFLYTQARQFGRFKGNEQKIVNDYISRRVPGLLTEKEYSVGNINKIFASHWLNDTQIAFGTKCNKVTSFKKIHSRSISICRTRYWT